MVTEIGEDKETIEAMRPAEATITQTIAHNHKKKGGKAADTKARNLA